jgi:virulence-associated protein VagC
MKSAKVFKRGNSQAVRTPNAEQFGDSSGRNRLSDILG